MLPLLVLGACSQDPEPTFSPPSETPSVSESTETSAAPSPEPWEEKSDEGAVAFTRYWIDDVFSQAMNDGDTDELAALSASGCGTCDAFIRRIKSIRADGGFYRSSGWHVLQADANDQMAVGAASVALRIHIGREVYRDRTDSKVIRHGATRETYEARLVWRKGAWLMSDLLVL